MFNAVNILVASLENSLLTYKGNQVIGFCCTAKIQKVGYLKTLRKKIEELFIL